MKIPMKYLTLTQGESRSGLDFSSLDPLLNSGCGVWRIININNNKSKIDLNLYFWRVTTDDHNNLKLIQRIFLLLLQILEAIELVRHMSKVDQLTAAQTWNEVTEELRILINDSSENDEVSD